VELYLHALSITGLDVVSGQLHAAAALSSEKKPQLPLSRRLDVIKGRSTRFREETNLFRRAAIEPRLSDA
jgi:hypothetical protein